MRTQPYCVLHGVHSPNSGCPSRPGNDRLPPSSRHATLQSDAQRVVKCLVRAWPRGRGDCGDRVVRGVSPSEDGLPRLSLVRGLTSAAISLDGTRVCLWAVGSLPSTQVAEMQANGLGVCGLHKHLSPAAGQPPSHRCQSAACHRHAASPSISFTALTISEGMVSMSLRTVGLLLTAPESHGPPHAGTVPGTPEGPWIPRDEHRPRDISPSLVCKQ